MLGNVLRQSAIHFGRQCVTGTVSAGGLHSLHQTPPSLLVSLLSFSHAAYAQQCSQTSQGPVHRCQSADWRQSSASAFSIYNPTQQSRQLAVDSQTSSDTEYPVIRPDHVFVYRGPLAQTVTRLKTLHHFGHTAKQYECAGMMHWFTSPYVHTLTYNSKTGLAEVETLTLFARHQRRTFAESEIQSPQTLKPQATFQVHSQVYYLDADNFEDKALLAKLTPKEPEVVSRQK